MSANTVVIQGLVRPDGTFELEGKVPLPAGKVQVTVQLVPQLLEGDPFFEMLKTVRAIRQRDGMTPDAETAQAALQRLHDEVDEEVSKAGRLQENCRRLREAEGGPEEAG